MIDCNNTAKSLNGPRSLNLQSKKSMTRIENWSLKRKSWKNYLARAEDEKTGAIFTIHTLDRITYIIYMHELYDFLWCPFLLFFLPFKYHLIMLVNTVLLEWNWIKPILCTKWPKITMLFYYIKLPTCSFLLDMFLPFMRPYKWGTAWNFISRGIRITTSQS